MRRQQDLQYRGYDCGLLSPGLRPARASAAAKARASSESLCAEPMCFAMVDVTNHSLTYKMSGYVNHMSPDDHYQDLKRIIGATVRPLPTGST